MARPAPGTRQRDLEQPGPTPIGGQSARRFGCSRHKTITGSSRMPPSETYAEWVLARFSRSRRQFWCVLGRFRDNDEEPRGVPVLWERFCHAALRASRVRRLTTSRWLSMPPGVDAHALPGAWRINDEIFRPGEWGRLVFDGVDLQARQVASLDEEQDTTVALLHARGDQHAVLHRRVACARACPWAKIHRRASASTVPGDNCRRDLSPKLVRARKVLREKCQDDSLLLV